LPTEIGSLISLTHLSLSNNQLETLPTEIGTLRGLIHLDLSNNQLTTLPGEEGRLINLQVLDLRNNSSLEKPDNIGRLRIDRVRRSGLYTIPVDPTPVGFAYEIHDIFDNFDKVEYKALLMDTISFSEQRLKGLIVSKAGLISAKLICDYMRKLIDECKTDQGEINTLKANLELLQDKIGSVIVDDDEKELIILTQQLLDYLDSNKLKDLYLSNFILTSMTAYSGVGDNTSCVKGIIERALLVFIELLKNKKGICSNKLSDLDDFKDQEKKKKLQSLCDKYFNKMDELELQGSIKEWYTTTSNNADSLAQYNTLTDEKDRKKNCFDYLEKSFINTYDKKDTKDIIQKVHEELKKDTYKWDCNTLENLYLGCSERSQKVDSQRADGGFPGGRIKKRKSLKNLIKIKNKRKLTKVERKLIKKNSIKKNLINKKSFKKKN
jgi:hypothetical protein